ncbi:MAG TPA: serine/threonine-protein kinase [Spirochaetia bacterium]|nr:serine/threonine-protein kinase [Spirochaetia bacterium]
MARIPDSIGKYKVISEIARGGMGAVYKAEHPTLDRFVIIKKLTLRGNASVRERFRREASIMMDFRNEFIVDVFDHFREGPAYYIVQEFVDGMSLAEILQRDRYLPERVALLVFRDSCRALKYAHDRGVVHRDIKPGNILISRKGDVKLVDFGIAHVDDESENVLTREGTTLGTPSYMAPEQFQDTRNVDRRADIYSLGVMLYEMTTGKRPFPGSITAETMRLIQHGKYRKPRSQNPAISGFTARLICRTMHARIRRRYQDLSQILKKLDRRIRTRDAEEKSELASVLSGNWTPPKYRSPKRKALVLALLFVLLAGGGLSYYGIRSGLQYELFQPERYGSLQVAVRVTRGPRSAKDIFVSSDLFVDDGDMIPKAKNATLTFHRDPRQATSETEVFVSNRLYVPAGQYRLKVVAAGQLSWTGFYLESRERQRETGDRAAGRLVTVTVGPGPALPLAVEVTVTSAADGANITAESSVFVGFDGFWLPVTRSVAAALKSGRVYQFRVEHDGYYPDRFDLMVYPFQTNLDLSASLVPYPGAIALSTSSGPITLSVNGLHIYRAWGREPHPKAVPSVGSGRTVLNLAPGEYTLEAHRGTSVARYVCVVRPLERIILSISPGPGKSGLQFHSSGSENAPELLRQRENLQ